MLLKSRRTLWHDATMFFASQLERTREGINKPVPSEGSRQAVAAEAIDPLLPTVPQSCRLQCGKSLSLCLLPPFRSGECPPKVLDGYRVLSSGLLPYFPQQ